MAQPLSSKCRGGIQEGYGGVQRGLPHILRSVYTVPRSLHGMQLRYRGQPGRSVRVIHAERWRDGVRGGEQAYASAALDAPHEAILLSD